MASDVVTWLCECLDGPTPPTNMLIPVQRVQHAVGGDVGRDEFVKSLVRVGQRLISDINVWNELPNMENQCVVCDSGVQASFDADHVPHTREINMDSKKQLWIHMNEKLKGYAKNNISLVQNFLAALHVDAPTEKMGFGAKIRRWTKQLNEKLIPWIGVYAHLSHEKKWRRIAANWNETSKHTDFENRNMVYLRFNLENNDTYIGKTCFWENRYEKHYMEVKKHAAKKCKNCKEHLKYKRQATIPVFKWMTIPLNFAASEGETFKIERWYIKAWSPNLNDADKPLWQRKKRGIKEENKKEQIKQTNKKPRVWRETERRKLPARKIIFTEYTDEKIILGKICWMLLKISKVMKKI